MEKDKEPADMSNTDMLNTALRRYSYAVNNINANKKIIDNWQKREKLPPSDTIHGMLKTQALIQKQINEVHHLLNEMDRRSWE